MCGSTFLVCSSTCAYEAQGFGELALLGCRDCSAGETETLEHADRGVGDALGSGALRCKEVVCIILLGFLLQGWRIGGLRSVPECGRDVGWVGASCCGVRALD